jgi:hypothetical protein
VGRSPTTGSAVRRASIRRALLWAGAPAVALSVVGGIGVADPVAPAGADTAANCSSGVIVAADFATWGGNINSVCDPTLPPNSAEALVATGFDPVGVASYGGLAFICQIAGYPQGEDCNTTPPGNAYWSFWYANAGENSWTYSQLGAESLHPAPGSVEAWVFGGASGGGQPSIPAPDTVRADTTDTSSPTTTTTVTVPASVPTTTPTPTSPAGVASSTGGGSAGSGQHSTAGAAPVVPAGSTTGPTGATGTHSPSRSTHPGTTPAPTTTTAPEARGPKSSSSPRIVDAAPVSAHEQGADSPLPFLFGASIVAVLAAGAALVAWRRRRTD